jgi:outer membrane immunogenic protein
MLRRILLASTGVLALGGTVLAAEPTPAAPPPPPPMWTGFYIGLNAGYEWAANKSVDVTSVSTTPGIPAAVGLAALANGSVPVEDSGFIGGGQIGYNYQLFGSNWVAGIEADIDGLAGAHGGGSTASVGTFPPAILVPVNTALNATKSLDYLGTVRGRIGYLLTPTLLIYGTGGLAYGGVQSEIGIVQTVPTFFGTFTGLGVSSSLSNTQVGWTAGGGVEWMFLPNWSAKVEYLYYDLGTVTATALLNAVAPVAPITGVYGAVQDRTRFNGNIVRLGVDYHFNWGAPAPVVAKY